MRHKFDGNPSVSMKIVNILWKWFELEKLEIEKGNSRSQTCGGTQKFG